MRFARDRWYSGEGQRRLQQRARSESMGTRRIISLTLLLLMILVVMQQLGDPKKYTPAFEAIGLTSPSRSNIEGALESQPNLISNPSGEVAHQVFVTKEDSSNNLSKDRVSDSRRLLSVTPESVNVDLFMQMWLRLFASASPQVIDELAKVELSSDSHSKTNGKTDEQASLSSKTSEAALKWLDESQTRVDQWQQAYRSMLEANPDETLAENTDLELGMTFVTQWLAWASLHQNGVSLASSSLDPDLKRGLQLAIDRRLLGRVLDGSPWRPQERPTLARTLQRAASIAASLDFSEAFRRDALQAAPYLEATSLMKQTDEYRGQVVRLVGQSVTNADLTTQVIEGWGRFEYDLVWIRPLRGSQQPICVYSLRKPNRPWPTVASSSTSRSQGLSNEDLPFDGPFVEIIGILIKRMAYPSQGGVDVAPVLVALDVRPLPDASLDSIDDIDVRRGGSPRIRSRRWIEPGEQATNLQLLQDVFAKDLESLSDPIVQAKLTEKNLQANLDREVPQLGRVLYQIPRVSKPLAAAIATGKKIGPAQLASFQGWVQSVEPIRLRDTSAASGEASTIFRLRMEARVDPPGDRSLDETIHVAYVNQVPILWKSQPTLSQPISLSGVYLNATTEVGMTRCWIADHADWSWPWLAESSYSSEAFSPTLPDDWKHLGATGFDLSQVDLLRSLRGKSITSQESQAFYSLIDCGDRFSKLDGPTTAPPLSAADCLQEKNPPHLRRIRTKVNIVRATRIIVSDEHDQSALDGEAYYELDGLANLGNLSIQLKSPDGKENVLFEGEYPITLISKHIPGWLASFETPSIATQDASKATLDEEMSGLPATWYPRITVQVEGIFYRLWSFSTAQTSALGKANKLSTAEESRLKQIGPLVAVTKWENSPDRTLPPQNRSIARELTTAIVLSAIGIYGLYRLNQPSKRRKA